MALEGASAVLEADVTRSPGASMTTFVALPFPLQVSGPAYQPPREQHLPSLSIPSFSPGGPLVLPALPGTSLVSGEAGHGPIGTGAHNIVLQVGSEDARPQLPQFQAFVLTQAPLNWSAPGVLSEGAACPAPLFLEASAVETIMPTSAFGATPAGKGSSCPGLPPQAPPPAAQLAPTSSLVNTGPRPHGASREGGLATSLAKATADDSGNDNSVYKNFRRWQRFKALARRHLPQSPDAEALSCFLIPVLRSLSRRKPTMTLKEGLGRAMQEWQSKSNFDRMIYYEMAEKFMEFEAEEEMQIQKLQWMKGAQGPPPATPPRPDPRGPPAPVVGPQPASMPRKAVPKAQPAQRHQQPRETRAPKEIPPEAVKEYMDIMDELGGPAHSATGEPGGEWDEDRRESQQEEDGTYSDPGLWSYMEKLCSQEDFLTKVEAVIHPQFLAQLNSPGAQLDLLALEEELEQEEELSLAQLIEKRLQALKEEEGVQAPRSHRAPQLDPSPPETADEQDAQTHDHDPLLGINDKACSPEADFKDCKRHGQADTHPSRPKAFAVPSGHEDFPPHRARCLTSAPQGHRHTYSGLGPRGDSIPRGTTLVGKTRGSVDKSSEDEEDLPSLAFLLGSPNNLLPCGLSLSPVPASGLACPVGRGPCGAAQYQFFQTLSLSRAASAASKSRKHALGGDPAHGEETPLPGANLRVSMKPALALGLVHSSQPQKRKCDPSVTGSWRKRHCSQYGDCASPPEGPE
ncbi:NUT family member 2G-like [Rhynchonycteris naso]